MLNKSSIYVVTRNHAGSTPNVLDPVDKPGSG